ncbi:unnamed protein product [marine sediment metagenome]|uniref:Uncharacterized protein n=1 Tax=marine sediment metagenome TaxID=412755 RepID=X1BYA0_9ZZZZ
MYWWYSFYHPKTVTIDSVEYKACDYILFKDIFREAIELGLLYRVALGLGLDDAKKYLGLYGTQVAIRKANIKKHAKICAYRDGF